MSLEQSQYLKRESLLYTFPNTPIKTIQHMADTEMENDLNLFTQIDVDPDARINRLVDLLKNTTLDDLMNTGIRSSTTIDVTAPERHSERKRQAAC